MKTVATLLLACLLAGCQTAHLFRTPDSRWRTETGQLQYTNPKRSFIGEVVTTTYLNREFQFDFLAGPGFPVMKLRQEENTARVEAAFVHLSWQGRADRAPGPLKSWVGLREVFARFATGRLPDGRAAFQSDRPGFWKAAANVAGGHPRDLTVEFPKSRERFVFHFNR